MFGNRKQAIPRLPLRARAWMLVGRACMWVYCLGERMVRWYQRRSPVMMFGDTQTSLPPMDAPQTEKAAWMVEHFGRGWEQWIQQADGLMKYFDPYPAQAQAEIAQLRSQLQAANESLRMFVGKDNS